MEVRYRPAVGNAAGAPGATSTTNSVMDVREATWFELAQKVISGEVGEKSEVWPHEVEHTVGGGAAPPGVICCVGDLIDVDEAVDAGADDANEIAATMKEAFAAHCVAAAPVEMAEPEPELEPDFAGKKCWIDARLDALTPSQLAAFHETRRQLDGVPAVEVLAYVKSRGYDSEKAVTGFRATQQWRKDRQPERVTIADVAKFMRTPAGSDGPDGCMFVLEDGKGDCARDREGRPVVVSMGMCHGTAHEQQLQMIYASERVNALTRPDAPPGCSNVLEVVPQPGAETTFRFPDADVRSCFDLQKAHYPVSLSSTNHFVGIPRALTWGFKLCKPFMDAEAYANMKLWPNSDQLPDFIPPCSLLPRWSGSGTFKFDLDEYIAQRAAAEGVDPGTEVRRFGDHIEGMDEGTKPSATSENAMNASLAMSLKDVMSMGALDELAQENEDKDAVDGIVHAAVLMKRGGGGAFGNLKWKEKYGVLLAVGSGSLLLYFDSSDVSDSNVASRVVPLQDSKLEPEPGKDLGHEQCVQSSTGMPLMESARLAVSRLVMSGAM